MTAKPEILLLFYKTLLKHDKKNSCDIFANSGVKIAINQNYKRLRKFQKVYESNSLRTYIVITLHPIFPHAPTSRVNISIDIDVLNQSHQEKDFSIFISPNTNRTQPTGVHTFSEIKYKQHNSGRKWTAYNSVTWWLSQTFPYLYRALKKTLYT